MRLLSAGTWSQWWYPSGTNDAAGPRIRVGLAHLVNIDIGTRVRSILLKSGRVFFDGKTADAINDATITSLYDARVRIARDSDGYFHALLA